MNILKLTCIVLLFISSNLNNALAIETVTIRGGSNTGIPILVNNVSANEISDFAIADNIIRLTDIQLKDSQLFEFVYDAKQKSILKKFFNPLYEPDFFPFEINLYLTRDIKDNNLQASVEIYDARGQKTLISDIIYSEAENWQIISNKISDMIFFEFTGVPGIYNTEIVFISEKGPLNDRQKRIARMDLYGHNFRYITTGKNLVLTPKIGQKGDKIYFSSYVGLRPKLFVYNQKSNRAKQISRKDHMEFTPSLSSDGKLLYYTAIIEGNAEIMKIKANRTRPKQLTYNIGIDTSPSVSPDDTKLAFSSDRYGKSQIMLYNLVTKKTERFDLGKGAFLDPAWSPDGKYIAFVRILHNQFAIGIINIQTMESKILTEGYKVESPVFAPNSKYIMFTKRDNDRISTKTGISYLFIVDLNGNIIKRVPTPTDASEADWKKIHD